MEELNHPNASTLTHALAGPPDLPDATRTGNHVAHQRVPRDESNEIQSFLLGPDLGGFRSERLDFDDCNRGESHTLIMRQWRMW